MPSGPRPLVAVEPPCPLEEEVYGGEVRVEEVKVQVQALLRHLGGHQDGPLGPRPPLAEEGEDHPFP